METKKSVEVRIEELDYNSYPVLYYMVADTVTHHKIKRVVIFQ